MPKRELFMTRMAGAEPMVTMSIEGQIDVDAHQELALFTPAVMAAVNALGTCRAWYDDEEHSLTITRNMDAPPRRR